MSTQKKFERLPLYVKPTLYDLSLKVDLKNFTFSGQEAITAEVERVVDKIILNSKELRIENAQLVVNDGSKDRRVLIPQICLVEEEETLILQFSDDIPAGKAVIHIEFSGELRDDLEGFYRSRYTKVAGEEERYFAVTQFEATNARRCFPCWDEPAIKAFFDITLEVDSTKVALSNMPIDSETQIGDGFKRVKFQRTPRMSSYLVAFVVGEFDYVEDISSDGVVVRVYAPPGNKEQGKFALHIATKVLSFYKEYFQIAYLLPKIDLIAISEMETAMENWGLITFKESVLLVDEANTSVATKQNVALCVGHEIAHQWFGNLVTMEWWTHLWLKEGYASFIEFLCVDHLFPDYDIWTQFVPDVYCSALRLDALKNSHPIEVPVGHPSEVDEIFDNISYQKGASVIRMLHRYIGEKDFKTGMNLYLTRHQYGNTRTEDLWAALEEVSGKPIAAVMSTWTKQVGFPVITVESSVQENDSRVLVLSQSKFHYDGADNDDGTFWLIPVSFCAKSNPDRECFFTTMETHRCEVVIPNVKAEDWIKLNQGTVGFYRTKYPSTLMEQFMPSIRDKSLPPLDRLGILDDLFALVLTGQARTTQALDLIWAMKEEDNYTVWANISDCLERIRNLLVNTDYLHLFDAYGIRVMKHIYNQLGLEVQKREPHLTTLLRNLVLDRLITFGATDLFLHVVREKFEKHCNGTDVIAADQRRFIYRAVLASDGRRAYDELLKLHEQSDMLEEKNRILGAFSAIVDADLVDDVLQLTRSNTLSPPEALLAIVSIAQSKIGRVKTFDMIKDHYDQLRKRFSGVFMIGKCVKCCTENFASEEKANEIEAFFTTQDTTGVERTIQQSLETIRNKAAWLQREGEQIKNYLLNLKL